MQHLTRIITLIFLWYIPWYGTPARAGDNDFADISVSYRMSVFANASTGNNAPYMLGSWNYGRITGKSGIWNNGEAVRAMSLEKRVDWGAGVEYMLGYGSPADYQRWNQMLQTFEWHGVGQAPVRLQQLYAEGKYRGAYITVGMKNSHSGIVDDALSSGDYTRSNNARPVPGIAIGFVDFQDIPYTNGWLQIDGELMYGKMTDSDFKTRMFAHYNGLLTTGLWYTYKRCYFRTRPDRPLSVTFGMQAAGTFAGSSYYYNKGVMTMSKERGFQLRDLWDMFIPFEGEEDYYKGSSLGSWDFKARYNFRDGSVLKAYFEWPWEDGSGIGRRNGWDGIWGLQYNFSSPGIVSKVLFEYLDFTNQSGPVHFSPGDAPGSTLTSEATGGDDYYNNDYYGPYTNYGMSIGTPFIMSPLYNKDGFPEYLHSRCRGVHAAVSGVFAEEFEYRAMLSYQRAGGSGRFPAEKKISDTSAMIDVTWTPENVLKGLSFNARAAFDAGKLRGNNFGIMLGVSFRGDFSPFKKNRSK